MLSTYDYIVLGFYFVFMASMGWVFKRFIKNTSDYFRSGGEVLWWIVGASAFMTNFSAVSFTGMAGKAYLDGPVVLVIFIAGAIGFFFNYIHFGAMFRQMRCVTAMDAVRKRFGETNEQFFTWIQIPTGILYAAIWLNGLAVFLSAAFDLPHLDIPGIGRLSGMNLTIIITAAVVLVMALLGGSWTSTASDFVQMLLLMPVAIVTAVLALIKVGGVSNFVHQTPTHFWKWNEVANGNLILLWVIAILAQKWVSLNNMTDASRYLSVKDTSHARKAALLATILFTLGPIVWFIPPMVSRITHPDLASQFPALKNPQDASYFAIAMSTMPAGMLGLLISGIFAATMGNMDSGLNRNAGYFIKNFYQVQLRPNAGERELMLASRAVTIVFAVIIVLAAIWFASLDDMPIFKLMVNFGGFVALPISIPLIWGMFLRRAPSWAGWSTVLVGLATSYLVNQYLTASLAGSLFGFELNQRESSDWSQAAGILINILAGTTWFLLTAALFPVKRRTRVASAVADPNGNGAALSQASPAFSNVPSDIARVDAFFAEMRTPVDFEREEQSAGTDNLQARTMGLLCLIYGGFMLLLMAIPNPLLGRLAFLFCGAVMFGVGALLWRAGKPKAAVAGRADSSLVATSP